MEIEWEEPPANAERPVRHGDFADALRQKPFRWAVFRRHTSNAMAGLITRGGLKAFESREFEGKAVYVGGGYYDIYARHIGSAAAP